MQPPRLTTERLLLRQPEPRDTPRIETLVAARGVAAGALNIPHPYPAGGAQAWLDEQRVLCERGRVVFFALLIRASDELIGAMEIRLTPEHEHGELGYWVGEPHWGRGYATEAARAVCAYGFDVLRLHRIHAHHLHSNPASGRVLEKLGMQREGTLREHVLKWGRFEDVELYGLLRSTREPG